jgi:site-specific recombinase XerD
MISIQTKRNKNGEAVPTSDSYKQTIWSVLNSFVTYLFKKNIIPVNYMENVMRPKNKDEVKRYYLTEEDFQKILQCVRREGKRNSHKAYARAVVSRNLLIFILFMVTGMRRTALSDIDVGDIDFQKRTLTIVDKGEVEHVYYLDTSAMGYIEQWINDRNDILEGRKETALFITNKKERLSDSMIYDIVKEYTGKALGYQISPHKLRAGFCTILYDKTHDIKFVSKAVGHRDVSTTQIYIQTDNTDQIKAAKMMGGII